MLAAKRGERFVHFYFYEEQRKRGERSIHSHEQRNREKEVCSSQYPPGHPQGSLHDLRWKWRTPSPRPIESPGISKCSSERKDIPHGFVIFPAIVLYFHKHFKNLRISSCLTLYLHISECPTPFHTTFSTRMISLLYSISLATPSAFSYISPRFSSNSPINPSLSYPRLYISSVYDIVLQWSRSYLVFVNNDSSLRCWEGEAFFGGHAEQKGMRWVARTSSVA